MRSTSSSSIGGDVLPGVVSGSAQRLAISSHLKIVSIGDVQRWLAEESITTCSSVDLSRIREAAAVLSRPNPRKEDVRPLQSKWKVSQTKKHKKSKPLSDVLVELEGKVIKESQKLQQQLSDSASRPASSTNKQPIRMEETLTTQSASSSAQLPVSNALEESAAMDTTDNVDDANDLMLRRLKDRQRKRAHLLGIAVKHYYCHLARSHQWAVKHHYCHHYLLGVFC